jgi:hypothetical protein
MKTDYLAEFLCAGKNKVCHTPDGKVAINLLVAECAILSSVP